jgi:hypothetical protein
LADAVDTHITITIYGVDVAGTDFGERLEHFLHVGQPWSEQQLRIGIGIRTVDPADPVSE